MLLAKGLMGKYLQTASIYELSWFEEWWISSAKRPCVMYNMAVTDMKHDVWEMDVAI